MKLYRLLPLLLALSLPAALRAQEPVDAPAQPSPEAAMADAPAPDDSIAAPAPQTVDESARQAQLNTTAAAVVGSGTVIPRPPDFLEHIVDVVLRMFDVRESGNTATHYIIAAVFLVGSFLLRKVVTHLFFGLLKRWSARTETTLDDKLFHALETPVAALITVGGAVCALKVLKLSATGDVTAGYLSTIAFSTVFLWLFLRAFNAILDHLQEIAREKEMGIAAFMPWIRKTLLFLIVIFGGLMIAQSLGANVKAFLAGLGIGGLAFALAAQDTIANVFGSIVVAVDQPFKLGETVQIGSNTGTIEDIGLRSTRIRKLDKSLITIPNKTVAGEVITNLSRFTGRRVEQTLGLTYSTTAAQMEEAVAEVRKIILAEPDVDPASVIVYFKEFGASSLDIWVVYNARNPDLHAYLALKQRLNLALMRAIEARGLSMAFPTQTIEFAGDIARRMAGKEKG